jgi:hypothetical protein
MTGWVKINDDVVFDSIMQALPAELFKAWFNLLCLASKHGGRLPDLKMVAFALRVDETAALEVLKNLRGLGLFIRSEDGTFTPHKWHAWRSILSRVDMDRGPS